MSLALLAPPPRIDPLAAPHASVLARVAEVPQRSTVPGYSRELFGDWAPAGDCTTREETVRRQGGTVIACRVSLERDPYTGGAAPDVEVDHVLPLSAAWDLGAHSWPPERRRALANDPRNLVATSATANRNKSDRLPSEWMPERPRRCWYSRRLAAVASAYELPLPRADLRVMRRSCGMLPRIGRAGVPRRDSLPSDNTGFLES